MRTILFKGRDADGEWHTGDLQTIYGCAQIANNHGTYDVLRETVCQYTGLKDATGCRIFEGDILKVEGVATQYTVIFEKCGFEMKRSSVLFGMLSYEHSQYTVTGNIHDAAKEGGE